MRIITYNLRQLGKPEQWRGLQEDDPDLLLLQESSAPERYAVPDAGGAWLWQQTSTTRFGSAIWARGGRLAPVAVPGYEGWISAAIANGMTSPAGKGSELFVASLHVPQGPGGYVATAGRMLDALAPLCGGRPAVIGGDFNMTVGRCEPGSPRTNRAEQRVLDRLEGEFGMIGCWQAANPGEPLAQTLRWVGNRETPYHCDGIFVPAGWAASLERCAVLPPTHPAVLGASGKEWSDHSPVAARFRT